MILNGNSALFSDRKSSSRNKKVGLMAKKKDKEIHATAKQRRARNMIVGLINNLFVFFNLNESETKKLYPSVLMIILFLMQGYMTS